MKGKVNKLLLIPILLISFFIGSSRALAANHTIAAEVVKCPSVDTSDLETSFYNCLDGYYDGSITPLASNAGVEADSYIIVTVRFLHGGNNDVYAYTTNFNIDSNFEYVYVGEGADRYSVLTYISEDDLPIYTKGRNKYKWSPQANLSELENKRQATAKGIAAQPNTSMLLDGDYDLASYFFHVKKTAKSREVMNIEFNELTDLSDMNTNSIPFNKQNVNLYVAGETKSEDATLKTLELKSGETLFPLTPELVPGSGTPNEFNVVVPYDVTSLSVTALANDAKAEAVSITGNDNFVVGEGNKINIIVTAEDLSTKTYTINVYRLNNEAFLKNILLNSAEVDSFAEDNFTYDVREIPFATSRMTVAAPVKDGSKAKVISGTTVLSLTGTGDTPTARQIVVNAENCNAEYASVPLNECTSNTYTVNVYRAEPSTNNNLMNLVVNNHEFTEGAFNEATKTYHLNLANNEKSITLTATVEDPLSTITVNNKPYTSGTPVTISSLNLGNNEINVSVTSENGDENTYTLNVYRLSNDTTLKAFNITSDISGDLTPAYSDNETKYQYIYEPTSTNISISTTVNTTSKVALIDATGEHTLEKGESNSASNTYAIADTSKVIIYVTGEDNSEKAYEITFVKGKSSNNLLKDLKVSSTTDGVTTNYDLTPKWGSAVTNNFLLTVPANVEALDITAIPDYSEATATVSENAHNLNFDSNIVTITVTAENGAKNNYYINVTRQRYSDASLKELKVTSVDGTVEYDLVPPFEDPEVLDYTLSTKLPYSVDKVKVVAAANNSWAEVTGAGEISLDTEWNNISVNVKAQDGTLRSYSIRVYRDKNTDTGVYKVMVGDYIAEKSKADEYTYEVTVGNEMATVTPSDVKITPIDKDNATISKLSGTINLSTTTENQYSFSVTAQNTDYIKPYTIIITREKSDVATMDSVTLGLPDGTSRSCDPVSNTCKISVPEGTTNFTLTPSLAEGATSDALSSYTLTENPQEFIINVTSEDESVTVPYTIVVERGKANNAHLEDIVVTDTSGKRWVGSTTKGGIGFDPEQETYYVTVTTDITAVKVNPVLEDNNASYVMTTQGLPINNESEIALTHGDENRIKIEVTAEDGNTTDTYYVRITREYNTDTTLKTLNINGLSILKTNEDGRQDTNYDFEVANFQVYEGTLLVETTDPNASFTILNTTTGESDVSGVLKLKTGKNVVKIDVTAQDRITKNTYTVNITRPRSKNTEIESVVVAGVPATCNNVDKICTVDVPNNVTVANNSNVVVTLVDKSNDYQNGGVSSLTDVNLVLGEYVETNIRVTAEDSSVTDNYTLRIKRLQLSSAYLTSLVIASGSDPDSEGYTVYGVKDFASGNLNYEVELPIGTTSFYVSAVAGDNGTFTGDGPYVIDKNGRDVVVIVTSEDKSTTERYNVKVTRKLDDDNKLKSLNVSYKDSEGTKNPDIKFNPDTNAYTIIVPDSTTSVTMSGEVRSALAKAEGFNTFAFDVNTEDTKSYKINVTSESGEANAYWVIIKSQSASEDEKDATLENLYVTGTDNTDYPFAKKFTQGFYSYTIGTIGYDVDKLVINAISNASNPTIRYYVGDELQASNTINIPKNIGDAEIKVEVTSEDGKSAKTYIISYYKGNNNAGVTIKVDDELATFDENKILELTDKDKIKLNITPEDEKATITIDGMAYTAGENKEIDVTDKEEVKIKVVSDDRTITNEYTIKIKNSSTPAPTILGKITSEEYGHNIDDDYIYSVEVYSVFSDFAENELDNDAKYLSIYDKNGNKLDNNIEMKTGMIIKLIIDGEVKDQKYVVIKGDVNGDGEVDTEDAGYIINHYMETNMLTGPYLMAGDISGDGEADTEDAGLAINHYMEYTLIDYKAMLKK